jgi:hypothetical protein
VKACRGTKRAFVRRRCRRGGRHSCHPASTASDRSPRGRGAVCFTYCAGWAMRRYASFSLDTPLAMEYTPAAPRGGALAWQPEWPRWSRREDL